MDYAWLRERMQARYGIEKSDFVLVYIGRFGAEKSIGDLLMLLSWALMEQPHTSSCWSATGRNESISPFLVLQRLRSIVAVSTARAFLRNAVISGSGLGDARYHWGLVIGSSVSSLCVGMKDVSITFGMLRGALNENAGANMGTCMAWFYQPQAQKEHLGNQAPITSLQYSPKKQRWWTKP